MPEALDAAWGNPGLIWLALAAFMAGLVRGFSGFGTALIYLPGAAQSLPPLWAIVTLAVMDLVGPIPNLPGAARKCFPRDLARLLAGTLVMLPIGLLLLVRIDPDLFRYAVSVLTLGLLGVLISGWRYYGRVTSPALYGIGGASGFLGGLAGLPGPPVILFYMASPHPVSVVRANTMLFLYAFDFMVLLVLGVQSVLEPAPVLIGLLIAVPNLVGNAVGAAVFRPDAERVYKYVAYAIIAASAFSGLPVWDRF